MNKYIVVVIAAIVVFAVGGFVVMSSDGKVNKPVNTTPVSQQQSSVSTNSNGTSTNEQPAASNVVTIKNSAFSPAILAVKVGTTVTWNQEDSLQHDIVPDKSSSDFEGSQRLLAKGESYSYTFTKAGTYKYHCTPHPFMKGAIEVTD